MKTWGTVRVCADDWFLNQFHYRWSVDLFQNVLNMLNFATRQRGWQFVNLKQSRTDKPKMDASINILPLLLTLILVPCYFTGGDKAAYFKWAAQMGKIILSFFPNLMHCVCIQFCSRAFRSYCDWVNPRSFFMNEKSQSKVVSICEKNNDQWFRNL